MSQKVPAGIVNFFLASPFRAQRRHRQSPPGFPATAMSHPAACSVAARSAAAARAERAEARRRQRSSSSARLFRARWQTRAQPLSHTPPPLHRTHSTARTRALRAPRAGRAASRWQRAQHRRRMRQTRLRYRWRRGRSIQARRRLARRTRRSGRRTRQTRSCSRTASGGLASALASVRWARSRRGLRSGAQSTSSRPPTRVARRAGSARTATRELWLRRTGSSCLRRRTGRHRRRGDRAARRSVCLPSPASTARSPRRGGSRRCSGSRRSGGRRRRRSSPPRAGCGCGGEAC